MGVILSKPLKSIWYKYYRDQKKICVWILGGPGSGRTTQSQCISDHFQLFHVSAEREIHNVIENEEARKPVAKRRRLQKKRRRIHNAIKLHETMTSDEKEFLGIHESTADAHLLSFHFQSDTEEDEMECPVFVRSIEKSIKHGYQFDPYVITKLLKTRMREEARGFNGFVLDGYPRDLTQALLLSQSHIRSPHVIIFLDCPDNVLGERLIARAIAAQRSDDNELMIPFKLETWRRRSKTMYDRFVDTMHIVDGNRPQEIVADECFDLIQKKADEINFRFQKFSNRFHQKLWRNVVTGASKLKVGVTGASKGTLRTHLTLNKLEKLQ